MADMKQNVFSNGSVIPTVVSEYNVKVVELPVNTGTGIQMLKLNRHAAKLTHDPSKPMEGGYFAKFNPAAVTTFGAHSYPNHQSQPKGERYSPTSKFIPWDTFRQMLKFAQYKAPYASNTFPLPGTVCLKMWLGKDSTENRIDAIGGPDMMAEVKQIRESADADLDLNDTNAGPQTSETNAADADLDDKVDGPTPEELAEAAEIEEAMRREAEEAKSNTGGKKAKK